VHERFIQHFTTMFFTIMSYAIRPLPAVELLAFNNAAWLFHQASAAHKKLLAYN
jgi:hypothetical protein